MLGYTPRQVGGYYIRMVAKLNGAILLSAIVVAVVASFLWKGLFGSLGLATTGCFVTIVVGIALMALVTAVNIMALRRNVNRNFFNS